MTTAALLLPRCPKRRPHQIVAHGSSPSWARRSVPHVRNAGPGDLVASKHAPRGDLPPILSQLGDPGQHMVHVLWNRGAIQCVRGFSKHSPLAEGRT
jgi:hypothetical protein